MPKRLYTPADMVSGIKAFSQLRQHSMSYVPMTNEIETLDGHCTGCKGKKTFQVEGEEKMKNGAVRKYGKCPEGSCGRTISTFVKGVQDGPA